MLEKQKNWCKEKAKKWKELVRKNKGAIGFGLGMAAMVGIHLISEKLDEPKGGSITFNREEMNDNHVIGRVYYNNRFGTQKEALAIDFGREGEGSNPIKHICDDLNEIVYPGD